VLRGDRKTLEKCGSAFTPPNLNTKLSKKLAGKQRVYYYVIQTKHKGFDMSRNTSITLGEHYSDFLKNKINQGRFQSASEAVRAGLNLLEEQEMKLDLLRETLATGEAELNKGQKCDGDAFMKELTA
jgi:antitoxin ParD1/3/4